MTTSDQAVIVSASRRTDIPAFYMDWFMAQMDAGCFNIVNPYNRRTRTIPCDPDHIHTIVFWSKNFEPFIESNAGQMLEKKGFHLYFNFTVNAENPFLEPNIPPLARRLAQLDYLCRTFGADKIAWRFDPVCFYRVNQGPLENNLAGFSSIAAHASSLGIKKCVTSFADLYPKILHRQQVQYRKTGVMVELVKPDMPSMKQILVTMGRQLSKHRIELCVCCEKQLFHELENTMCIQQNACIDGSLLKNIYGGTPDTRRDYGQRAAKGCRCTRSVDIGSYTDHPCGHDCFFCYASPAMDYHKAGRS